MKSNKQRRLEIKARRLRRAKKLAIDTTESPDQLPLGAVLADHNELRHNDTYGLLPVFYVDRPFVCRDCGAEEVWTAKQQKWWYEIAKGHIDSCAVRCRSCRRRIREIKAAQKVHMEERAKVEPHPNEAFFRSKP